MKPFEVRQIAFPLLRSSLPRSILAGLAGLACAVLVAGPAVAQDCSNVSYRLWTEGASDTWYQMSETVEIQSGREGHIYLHVDSRSESPYSTSAEIRYPEKFGFSGRSTDVARHVKMQAVNDDDRSAGRIRFHAAEPGTTRLGFRLTGVRSPGTLDLVPTPCRTGTVPIRVVAQDQGGGQGGEQGDEEPTTGPAEELVTLLYKGLLRRPKVIQFDQGMVDLVRRDARDGVLSVAETVMKSREFREEALRRTEATHGRNSLEELRRLLLSDIYRDLYGFAEPDRETRQNDLLDLEDCLNGRSGKEACSRLGRELVSSSLFYEHNREVIDALSRRRPGRR